MFRICAVFLGRKSFNIAEPKNCAVLRAKFCDGRLRHSSPLLVRILLLRIHVPMRQLGNVYTVFIIAHGVNRDVFPASTPYRS